MVLPLRWQRGQMEWIEAVRAAAPSWSEPCCLQEFRPILRTFSARRRPRPIRPGTPQAHSPRDGRAGDLSVVHLHHLRVGDRRGRAFHQCLSRPGLRGADDGEGVPAAEAQRGGGEVGLFLKPAESGMHGIPPSPLPQRRRWVHHSMVSRNDVVDSHGYRSRYCFPVPVME